MSTVETSAGARAARRASRRPRVQHLITADEHSLTDLQILLTTLPLCAVGRVFIEVPDADHIGTVSAPARMTVTWLPRKRRDGVRRAAGVALTRAAVAWADEMLCDESEGALRTEVVLLGDYVSTADIAEHLTRRLEIDAAAIRTPARYGIARF
ncbi:SIP domain-containing protein [Microbacterium sp. ARD32]|uniref:SIP domain-containing protein n=1 Tax=Microbacterium sp. ARD32 TaxID=2962577 RepID=UPI0028817329|nr:SIP domain-containing protein [Microbacterium sp. ARD32]MDT0156837.1 SIP domain-containing protein [Microbacterium sp. ARD32]